MKKSYVKPEVTLVRFELSEAIASCSMLLYDNHAEKSNCQISSALKEMGVTVTGDKNCDTTVESYCYFTSASLLMNS